MADQTPVAPPVPGPATTITNPAGGGGATPPPLPPTGPSSAEFAALQAELAEYKAQDSEKSRAESDADRAKLEKKATEAEARAEKLHATARKQAALSALHGLKKPDFLTLVMDKVTLDENTGLLTDDSKKALEAWKLENAYLFEDGHTPPGNHPVGKGGAGSKFTAEEEARIARYGGVVDAAKHGLRKLFA